MLGLLFILFAGLAIGCGLAVVAQRNPLYSAISLIGVFISLACLYVMLAAPFIAAVQVIVYAGAIMVLVVFVIMLLNVEQEERGRTRLKFLMPAAIAPKNTALVNECPLGKLYVSGADRLKNGTGRGRLNASLSVIFNSPAPIIVIAKSFASRFHFRIAKRTTT